MSERTAYCTNRELLAAIHASKDQSCEYIDPKFSQYDLIVPSLHEITPKALEDARSVRVKRLNSDLKGDLDSREWAKVKDRFVEDQIPTEDLVFRVMTCEHIPLDPNRKVRGTTKNPEYKKTSFLPFKHYIMKDGEFVEVGRSHSKDGAFYDAGTINNDLARMLMLIVSRYASKPNFRGYSYVHEMECSALVQLCQVILQFNEYVSSNVFAYATSIAHNCFIKILNHEKKQQVMRDEMLEMHGLAPSSSRQNAHHHDLGLLRHAEYTATLETYVDPEA